MTDTKLLLMKTATKILNSLGYGQYCLILESEIAKLDQKKAEDLIRILRNMLCSI